MKRLTFLLMLFICAFANAANTKTTVAQVTSAVSLTADEDYVITGTTPFATTGSIDIQNLEHGAVIISAIKPSKVISNWLSYVKINGEKAVNGENCQVNMYGKGAIIFPYGSDFAPLTCYTEKDFAGESCNTYREGNSGGFMLTLSNNTLNNKIRSFKLKRGYMVTFALGTSGWGYSRCFIAHDEDLEMNMPANMDARVSSYRLFKWYYSRKAGLASNGNSGANDALNSTWCYDWGQGNESLLPDQEWVPNHIYEDWPSAAVCGGVTQSCHMKTNNEPGNSADDHPQDVATVLGNWQNLMRTGMRLCSESSHDGSMNHLKSFIDSIDARGWRCDILDLHCYWSGNFGSLAWYSSNYGNGRPIWISEWIWGASWNHNGAFGSDVTDAQILSETKNILNTLNSTAIVERYAYWNSESKAHIYENGSLTELGKYYASMEDGIGFNKSNEYVPKVVYASPTNLTGTYNISRGTYAMTWTDTNGDMLDSMIVECKLPGATKYTWCAKVSLKDINASTLSYSYTDTPSKAGAYYYRVAAYPIGSRTPKYSGEVSVSVTESFGNSDVQYGSLSVANTTAVTSNFTETLAAAPALFMGICSNNNSSLYPGNLLTSVGTRKFSYQVTPWQAQGTSASTMNKAEDIPFLALQTGNYKYGDLDCEVGVVKIKDEVLDVTFQKPFPTGVVPVVLVEVRNPTIKKYPYSLNIIEVTNTGFKAQCQYEASIAASNTMNLAVDMSYLAITPGVGNLISEVSDSVVLEEKVLSSTPCVHDDKDCIEYVVEQTVRDTYSHVLIAAGIGENNMWGRSNRVCTFKIDDEQLYFKNPKVFGKCQSSNYPGATILRLASYVKDTDQSSEYYGYVTGIQVKRQVDATNSSAHTEAYGDPLGYVVVDQSMKDTYAERTKTVVRYEEYDPTKVENLSADTQEVVAIYNLAGAQQPTLQKGINILKYANGSFKKVFVK